MIENNKYVILTTRELKCTDQELMDSQNETIKFVMMQIGGNLFSGKSILNISLPVQIFEDRSALQRGASSYASCPDFLQPVANSDIYSQINAVTSFIINAITC